MLNKRIFLLLLLLILGISLILTSIFSYSITGHVRLISTLLNYNQIVNNLNDNINIIKLGFNPKDIINSVSNWFKDNSENLKLINPKNIINNVSDWFRDHPEQYWTIYYYSGCMLLFITVSLVDVWLHPSYVKLPPDEGYLKFLEEYRKIHKPRELPISRERSAEGMANFVFISCYIVIYFCIKNKL
jgi:hypothetical protein